MLSCGHDTTAYGAPLCVHMRTCRKPWLEYVKWYTGQGLTTQLICVACAEMLEKGQSVEVEPVCEECFDYAIYDVCDLVRAGGKPEIRVCDMPFDSRLKEFEIPKELGRIVDIAPVNKKSQPIWLMLTEGGNLFRVNTSGRDWARVGSAMPPSGSEREPLADDKLRKHLHASRGGEFAAVVNDYGRYGQVIDLRSGNVTLELDGGEYANQVVPFSFAFAELKGRVVAIHRTEWNRLDISDPSDGKLLTERACPANRREETPPHFLNYFHGALYVSPGNTRILDDGWVWHPVGVPFIWDLDPWLSENPWESEDGPTLHGICWRHYYWDHGMTWLDEEKVAIGGIGEIDLEMIDGALIFDVTQPAKEEPRWRSGVTRRRQLIAFPGPTGKFFSNGKWLYSSDKTGLSRWDPQNGARTGHLDAFHPTHYHPGAGQLVQLTDSTLVQWSTTD